MASVIHHILLGEVPEGAASCLARSRLIALAKGDTEEARVRHIAIGEVLHRMAGRWLAHHFRAEMTAALAPLKFGVGVPDGVSLVARSVASH